MPSDSVAEVPCDLGQFSFDPTTRTWRWSVELFSMVGAEPRDDLTTDDLLAWVHPDDRKRVGVCVDDLATSEGPFCGELRAVGPSGRVRSFTCVGDALPSDGGSELEGYVVDITDFVRDTTAEALAASNAHRAAIEQAKGALMVTHGVDETTAFSLLRAFSMQHNLKLRAVAEQLVERLAAPAYSELGSRATVLQILRDIDPSAVRGGAEEA